MNQPEFSRISPDVKLGEAVKIYAFVNLYGCEIGDGSKIGTFVEIQKGASIGKHVKWIAIILDQQQNLTRRLRHSDLPADNHYEANVRGQLIFDLAAAAARFVETPRKD